VKCENELGATEETRWNKVDAVGIIGWGGRNVSWKSIQIIMILISCYDTHRHFDEDEIARPTMPIHTNWRNHKP
jgi:hypothetical protein